MDDEDKRDTRSPLIVDTTAPPVLFFIGPEKTWGRAMAMPKGADLGQAFDAFAVDLEAVRSFFFVQAQKAGKKLTESIFCEMFRISWAFTSKALSEQQKQIESLRRELEELRGKLTKLELLR